MHASSEFLMFPILLHNESFVSLHVLVAYGFIDMNIEWDECTMQNAVEQLNILLRASSLVTPTCERHLYTIAAH
jgi:hypothetical protein